MIQIKKFDDTFFELLSDRVNLSVQRLNNYISDPSEKNVHDIRTSIRRVDTASTLIPKSSRKKKANLFIQKYKEFFKINSTIRDYDIILKKLMNYNFNDKEFYDFLNKKRERQITAATKKANTLLNLKTPDNFCTKKLSIDKINTEFNKRCIKLAKKIKDELPVVTSYESKVKKLHNLRITVKKLRYLLELQNSLHNESMLDNMKFLQQVLGEIHDSDMFIVYIKKKSKKHNSLKSIIMQEKNHRHRTYRKLSNSFNSI